MKTGKRNLGYFHQGSIVNLFTVCCMKVSLKNWFPYLLLAGILLNATGLFVDIIEPDSALYAAIAKHIAITNDWVNLIGDGHDWLDKPHLPFWLSAISFKCFGISPFAYKLPAFLCWLLGVFYLYKLAATIFSTKTARLGVIIYITALHVLLSNNDIRAEAYLTAFILAAIFHIYQATLYKWSWHLLYAAFYCALAIMTKGIFVLVPIAAGFIIYWLFTKQYKQFLQPKWWLLLLLIVIGILPELYCLYMQFDLHPEKIVFGRNNVSGLSFFFWDSQFGRFFNNGPIQGNGDIFFFLHTFLWAFLPWSFITCIAISRLPVKWKKDNNKTWLIVAGSLITGFVLFSLSKFQLPHYIVILLPHFAIITADYLLSIRTTKILQRLKILQWGLHVVVVFCILFLVFIYGLSSWYISLFFIMAGTLTSLFVFKGNFITHLAAKSSCTAIMLFLFLNTQFYPSLLQYQAGMQAGNWLNKSMTVVKPIMYKCNSYSFEFYNNSLVDRATSLESLNALHKNKTITLFTPIKEIAPLKNAGYKIQILQRFSYFHITQLNMQFLNQNTRNTALETYVLANCVKQ